MKKLVCLLLLGLIACAALAGELKTYTYPELSMKAPVAVQIEKNDFKNEFPTAGCCYVHPKAIAAMVVSGTLPDQMTMLNTMVKLTGVKLDGWMLTAQASNDARGWAWRREYSVVLDNKTVVYSVLGHGSKYAYLIILCQDKNEFLANQADYQAWRASLRVFNSGSNNHR